MLFLLYLPPESYHLSGSLWSPCPKHPHWQASQTGFQRHPQSSEPGHKSISLGSSLCATLNTCNQWRGERCVLQIGWQDVVMTPNASTCQYLLQKSTRRTPPPLADNSTCPWWRLHSVVTEHAGFGVRLCGLVNPASTTCCMSVGQLLTLSVSQPLDL